MNHAEAEQVAAAINVIRPDWPRKQITTILGRNHQHRPARDVLLALVWVAYDADTNTPARIDVDGPWWGLARLAGTDNEPTPVPVGWCSLHRCEDSSQQPCPHCRIDRAQAVTDPDQVTSRIAAVRAAIQPTHNPLRPNPDLEETTDADA